MVQSKHKVLIVGGGTAGITVAASLKRKEKDCDIAIIEPSKDHYYQPAFTLVGAGAYKLAKTRRNESSLIPSGVKWIQNSVISFDPEGNTVTLKGGDTVGYDYLVVCPGLELQWNKVDGLEQALGKDGVCSNYSKEHVEYTWECLQRAGKGDTLVFTQPPMPVKCPGAPQKIAYLAADYLRKKGILQNCKLHFMTHTPTIFGVPYFAGALVKVMARYGIKTHYQTNLVSIDAKSKKAVFEDADGNKREFGFNMLHVTPPQGAPAFVADSKLAGEGGWISVNQHSLQHIEYKNVFGLGDVTNTPNSKTAAAIRKQAPVVVRNLVNLMNRKDVEEGYDGYASCPLTTSYGKVLMAEFIYGGKVTPTLPLRPSGEYVLYWWVKVAGLPLMYWHYMLKGFEKFFEHNTSFVEEDQEPSQEQPAEQTERKKAA